MNYFTENINKLREINCTPLRREDAEDIIIKLNTSTTRMRAVSVYKAFFGGTLPQANMCVKKLAKEDYIIVAIKSKRICHILCDETMLTYIGFGVYTCRINESRMRHISDEHGWILRSVEGSLFNYTLTLT